MPKTPKISVVIPAFNRLGPLAETLACLAASARPPIFEVVLVDDGSTPAIEGNVAIPPGLEVVHLRQENQGSIAARLAGLQRARGTYVLFLDSDDLVHPDKLRVLFDLAERESADVAYDDIAKARRTDDGWEFEPSDVLPGTTDPATLFLTVQPAPHSPLYRRSYLMRHLQKPLVTPRREFDPAGDVWMYYCLCANPAKIAKEERALTATGIHEEDRFSRHWEVIAYAALAVMEAFFKACPDSIDLVNVRRTAGRSAFESWRRLPRGFDESFERRMLALWKSAPESPVEQLGGAGFQRLARLLGPQRAGELLRWRNANYASVRTVTDEVLAQLREKPRP